MNCINNAIALFQGQNQCAAITLAVAAFILGMIAMCLICKVFCPCGKKNACKKDGKKRQKKGEEKPFEKRKPHPAPADGSVEIYVGNLSYEMTDEQLRALFAKYGVVASARIITHRPSGKSKGYGFVEMPHRPEAELAVDKINNTEVLGRRIRCNEAREDSRPEH